MYELYLHGHVPERSHPIVGRTQFVAWLKQALITRDLGPLLARSIHAVSSRVLCCKDFTELQDV